MDARQRRLRAGRPLNRLDRRRFLGLTGTGALAAGVLVAGGNAGAAGLRPSRLGGWFPGTVPPVPIEPVSIEEATEAATAIVDDVVDFALASDDWPGDFGFVTMRIRHGVVDGNDVYFVRTDTSDEEYAEAEGLVYVPKIAPLRSEDTSGNAYVVEGDDDHPTVFSTEPGRDDYTPAWTLHRVTWEAEPSELTSEDDITAAEDAGDLTVERTEIVINAGLVKWSDGEMAVDEEAEGYLGEGQLLSPVDTDDMTAMFKLGQCYPGSRYFVLDHSIAPAAEMTATTFSPGLHAEVSALGATGRTNVFMNGLEGPGPMGFQPSLFDFDAGDEAWSPYWDHYLYEWAEDVEPRLLFTQDELHAARDDGELIEYPGMPDTEGEVFTVNCPVPVLAPPTFDPS